MLSTGPWRYEQTTLVVTSRELANLPKHTETVTIENLQARLTQLRKTHDNIWLMGGGETTRALLDIGELDEIEVYIVPELLGDGLPLFPDMGAFDTLRLIDTKTLDNGIAVVRYSVVAQEARQAPPDAAAET